MDGDVQHLLEGLVVFDQVFVQVASDAPPRVGLAVPGGHYFVTLVVIPLDARLKIVHVKVPGLLGILALLSLGIAPQRVSLVFLQLLLRQIKYGIWSVGLVVVAVPATGRREKNGPSRVQWYCRPR